MAPSTFASAAAGHAQNNGSARDASTEWPRRPNGATQTFRRPSGATVPPTASANPDSSLANPPRYIPPHRNGTIAEARYAKDQLLELYKSQFTVDDGLDDDVSNYFIGGWQPETANGAPAGWGRTEPSRESQQGPDLCWVRDGSVEPLGLYEMDDEERELFTTSVNTTIKPPPTTMKEGQQSNGLPGRKVSISNSNATSAGYGVPSPSVTRGGGRRREPSESYPFPPTAASTASPSTAHPRDDRTASPPPSLLRRRTDLKDVNKPEDRDKAGDDGNTSSPFGTLKRHPTGPLSGGFAAPASPWSTGPQSAGLSPMGSFGNFGLGANPGQQATGDKRPGLGSGRSESRFKNVLSKDAGDDHSSKTLEHQSSLSNLSRVNENESWHSQDRNPHAGGSADEQEDHMPTGSAALAADADVSPPHGRTGYRGFGTPSRQSTQDNFGFGAFGMTSDNAHAFGPGFLQSRDSFQQTPAHQRPGQSAGGNHEPMSPTDTNPYQSPEAHGGDRMGAGHEGDEQDLQQPHLPGLGGLGGDHPQQLGGLGGIGGLPGMMRGPGAPGDRGQNPSAASNRGFPGLGGFGTFNSGLGGSAAWPTQGGLGTPGRQHANLSSPFGGGVFSSLGDTQSPGLAGLGSAGHGLGQHPAYGGSRMASMFPPSAQDQLRADDREGASQRFGAPAEGSVGSDTTYGNQAAGDSSSNKSQQDASELNAFGAPGQQIKGSAGGDLSGSAPGQPTPGPNSASAQPPAPQQRTMVMPDRMRWIYRDPQGQTQGPWSGLEMHDWYKAGFFSPELLVKKYEDPDYEPLAQLIRRIGNSREPFLVPQIGIPHGPASNNGSGAWPAASSVTGSGGSGGAQPPFASSFPSFGTTLTADQQNALERRKQEEQYLMARQKEHLAQAQIANRMQMQGGHAGLMPQQLHHHNSSQSLHSQPSFGSISNPIGYQQSPNQGPAGGITPSHGPSFFDNTFRAQGGGLGAVGAGIDSLGHIREEEIPGIMDRLNISGSRGVPGPFGAPGQPFASQHQSSQQAGQDAHEQQVRQMLQDRARLEQEQAEQNAAQHSDNEQHESNERLQQFRQLQGQPAHAGARPAQQQQAPISATAASQRQEPLSLTEQVQKAASAKQSPAPQQPGLPQPFPPAPSQSPLPAPAAQRTGRQSVADQLQTESRDLSQTPSSETPSAAIAPWAKEPTEGSRGPSLKEIQEAEAKKAAEAEEFAASARRAAFQREMEAQAAAAAAVPAPGLPAASTWATGSPATPTGSVPAAWAKTAQKPVGPAAAKSMAQIQKEEEARKRKLATAAASAQQQANAMNGVITPAGGKSYANLAGKISAPIAAQPGGAWTTVGAGGKAKTPIVPGAPATVGARTVSAGVVPTLPSAASVAGRKPAAPMRSVTMGGGLNAQEEFKKWAVNELRPDLNKGINADDFIANLVVLPPDTDMITEAVHSVSNTIDSRHFAEEFLRRKKLADKGLVDTSHPPKSASPAGSGAEGKAGVGGWSEVAKKGPAGSKEGLSKDDAGVGGNGSFRVVAGRKKGAKR